MVKPFLSHLLEERMGFEPTNELPRYSISNAAPQRVNPRGYAISLAPDCSLTAVNIAGCCFHDKL